MQIEGSIIFITGAGGGIGEAMARRFASEAPKAVIVADIDLEAALSVAADIDGEAIQLDVSDKDATESVLAGVLDTHGHIDLLCLNAGVATGGSIDAPDAEWEHTWTTNVMSHVWATRAVLPSMLERRSGYVLVTASAAGLLTNIGAAPYSVTKHAAVALAEWLSITYGDRGIGVSCLCPQFVDTPMLDTLDVFDDAMREWVSDTAISAEVVADDVVAGLADERFLILPHREVADYVVGRATDRDGWIASMRRLQSFLRYEG